MLKRDAFVEKDAITELEVVNAISVILINSSIRIANRKSRDLDECCEFLLE